ncbi:MAG: DUF4838 domain-containing protein [Armatimonadota bacterium]
MSLIGLMTAMSLGFRSPANGQCIIVDQGRPMATIVVSAQPDPANLRAAQIFQSSVKKISGADLTISTSQTPGRNNSINIGFPEPKHAPPVASKITELPPNAGTRETLGDHLRPDGFGVYTEGTSLYVASGGKKGVIYGVVNFLERHFDCRCFSPTAYVFPATKTMQVASIFEAENPAVEFRAINGDFSKDADYLDWTRGNTTEEMFGRGYYVHTFNKLIPAESNLDTHPDFYAEMNGRRIADQLCPSSPAIVPIIVAKLKQEMAAQPMKHVWSVSQNDNESYCHCPTCTKIIAEEGAPSGPLLRMVNQVAKQFPNETISTLAYEWSRRAPKITKPAKNVQIRLCTIEEDRAHPIAYGPITKGFFTDITDWGRLTSNIYLWDYTVNFSHQVSPFPNLFAFGPNIQFIAGCGVRQIFEQSNTSPGHEFSELKAYMLARLLWNPTQYDKGIIHDFCQGYYGPGGEFVEHYIDELQAAMVQSKTRLNIFESPIAHANDFLNERHLDEYGTQLILAMAATGGEFHDRVATVRLQLDYVRMMIAANDMFGPRGFYEMVDGKPVPKTSLPGVFDDFLLTANKSHVRSLNERNLSPQEFRDSMVRLVTLDMAGNLAFKAPVKSLPMPSSKYAHGELALLTNGVHGGPDFRMQWLGWEGTDAEFTIDFGSPKTMTTVSLNSFSEGGSWILHPDKVECFVSADGKGYLPWGSESIDVLHKNEPRNHHFSFDNPYGPYDHRSFRYVMFRVKGNKKLPAWHPSAGGASWFFLDEVVIR